jgi:hypothetical protein
MLSRAALILLPSSFELFRIKSSACALDSGIFLLDVVGVLVLVPRRTGVGQCVHGHGSLDLGATLDQLKAQALRGVPANLSSR